MCTETDRSLSKHDSAQIFEEFSFCAAKLFVFIVFAQHISQAAHEPGITFGIYDRRFVSSEDDEDSDLISSKGSARALRQSGSAALFLVLCAWLRMVRFLTWPVALLLLVVLVSIEILMLTRH